ncbi:MAG: hypothetical protein QW514_01620 [Thermoprotei archaeon]
MVYYGAVIVLASELIASAVDNLNKRLDPTFLGGSILGFIANLPDIFIVVAAILSYSSSLAVAAILGGNIFTFTLGYALVITSNSYFNREELTLSKGIRHQLFYLILASGLIGVGAALGAYRLWLGVIMFSVYAAYMAEGIRYEEARADNLRKRLRFYTPKQANTVRSIVNPNRRGLLFECVKILVGCFLLVYSVTPFVLSIGRLSQAVGLPLLVSGVIIAPLAAEAPEIVSSVVLSRKSVEASVVAVSNLIGSKVQNNTLVFGLCVVISNLLGHPILGGENLAPILLLIVLNIYGFRATYDLTLTSRDALVSFALYPLAIVLLILITVHI